MTIGKRKGSAAKGAGGTGTNGVNKVGGSLSKNDHWYLHQAFGMAFDPGTQPSMEASGGSTTEYTDPTGSWKSHRFIASGSFVVTQAGGPGGGNVEYLIVGAGGGGGASGTGGYHGAGGGGGGCIKTNIGNNDLACGNQTYTVTIGAGGPEGTGPGPAAGPPANPGGPGARGGDSSLAGPDITTITAGGGGGAMGSQSNPDSTWPSPIGGKDTGGSPLPGGGSGAGGSPYPQWCPGQVTTGTTGHPGGIDIASPSDGWGNPGGYAPNSQGAGGGGGAAGAGGECGVDSPNPFSGGPGGVGAHYSIVAGTPTPVGYAGGGGGGGGNAPAVLAPGGDGGGGAGGRHPNPDPTAGVDGVDNTGGGGGGASQGLAGAGGPGIVVIRYKYP